MAGLLENPFVILGVTPTSPRREILEKAEEASLSVDPDLVSQCRAVLTNPAKRLEAELQFLPGVTGAVIPRVCDAIKSNPEGIPKWSEAELSGVARSNALIAVLPALSKTNNAGMASLIWEAARSFDQQTTEELEELINKARESAHFPAVSDLDRVSEALQEIRRGYVKAINQCLDERKTADIIDTLDRVLSYVKSGTAAVSIGVFPSLLDDLMNSYEVEAQGFSEAESAAAGSLVSQIPQQSRDGAIFGVAVTLMEQLQVLVRRWKAVIGILDKFHALKGETYTPSSSLFYEIRHLALEMNNEHHCPRASKAILERILEPLAASPEEKNLVKADQKAVNEIYGETSRDTLLSDLPALSLNPDAKGFKGLSTLAPRFSAPKLSSAGSKKLISAGRAEPGLVSRFFSGCGAFIAALYHVFGMWFVIGVIALFLYIVSSLAGDTPDDRKSDTSATKLVQRTPSGSTDASVNSDTPAAASRMPRPETVAEKEPDPAPVYREPASSLGSTFDTEEIAWCLKLQHQIDYIKPKVSTNRQINFFNDLVHRFNSTCSSFRYYRSSMRAAQNQVDKDQTAIEAEINKLLPKGRRSKKRQQPVEEEYPNPVYSDPGLSQY